MKKYLLLYIALLIGGAILLLYSKILEKTISLTSDSISIPSQIYINVHASPMSSIYRQSKKLQQAFNDIGKEVILTDMKHAQSGNFNLYIAESLNNLPKVLDPNAINILWLPMVYETDDVSPLRPFDVVVVKSLLAFDHLKAINVRTAFIPDAINIKDFPLSRPTKKAMFYGDNNGFSLSLYLAGRNKQGIDIYGKGFENLWPKEEIKASAPSLNDFSQYAVVLVDQSDDTIRDEFLDERVIEVIENGGVPFLRFNNGIYKIFGEALALYHSENEFNLLLNQMKNNPKFIMQIRQNLRQISQKWNSVSQAQKFSELFEIMQKKRR